MRDRSSVLDHLRISAEAMDINDSVGQSPEPIDRGGELLRQFAAQLAKSLDIAAPLTPIPRVSAEMANLLRKRFGPSGATLEERAQEVSEALSNAAELLDELQAEVRLRSVIIKQLGEQTAEAERRSEDAVRRAALDEEEAKAVDAYLDRTLQTRLRELEKKAKRREIVLGTVVALAVGVGSILISHYLFGF